MEPRKHSRTRLCVEELENRAVPCGCQAWGAHVSAVAQSFEPNLGALVSTIAHTESGAVAALVAADHDILCS